MRLHSVCFLQNFFESTIREAVMERLCFYQKVHLEPYKLNIYGGLPTTHGSDTYVTEAWQTVNDQDLRWT